MQDWNYTLGLTGVEGLEHWEDVVKSSSFGLRGPPTASVILRTGTSPISPIPPNLEETSDLFFHLLQGEQWRPISSKPNEPGWHCLGVLIRMRLLQFSSVLQDLEVIKMDFSKLSKARRALYRAAHIIRAVANRTTTQLDAFCYVHGIHDHEDVAPEVRNLKTVIKALLETVDIIQADEDRDAARRNVRMAELTMSESRSAIACEYYIIWKRVETHLHVCSDYSCHRFHTC